MIPKSFIQDLLNRLDIVDVIERYVPLKKAGANYMACCPFHNEKTPSFTVSQSKQFYHCFGCGAHGTAIGFMMEHGGMGFVEAVEELAKSVGLTVPREASAQPQQKVAPDLYELMQAAARYYRGQLRQSPHAIDYLKRRGMSGEIAARFGIGYAPDGWQNLERAVADYQDKSLLETGLVIVNDEGRRYDRFRDRIMFPIQNARGQVIGFGGRVLDKGEPKYLNSPETPLFEKGRELYGLYQAQKAIRAEGLALVVEGYMDVVSLAQLGVEYAVATLGTATTPFHVQKLLRMTDQVVFCFDGDAAGRRAAWRAMENSLPHLQDGKQLRFLFLDPEHDPDSYIREHGKDAFEHLLGEEAMPLSGYLLRELTMQVDLKTQEGRSALLEHARPLLTAITAPTTALLLRKEVARLAGISQEELEALYGVKSMAAPVRRRVPKKVARNEFSGERALLRCLLARPELGRELVVDWQGEGGDAAVVQALLEFLREQDFAVTPPALLEQFKDTQYGPILFSVAAEADFIHGEKGYDVAADFMGLLERQREGQLKQQLRALEDKGHANWSGQERELYRQLLTQLGSG